MANISLRLGSNPCVIACRSVSASHDPGSGSGSATDFYKLLSLSSNKAGNQEIKRAYRTLALKYHPDVSHDHGTTKTFILLQTAYKTLIDPVLREEYDCTLSCHGCTFNDHVGEGRRRWEGQIVELRRRSSYRADRKEEGSWGSRVRYGNRQNKAS